MRAIQRPFRNLDPRQNKKFACQNITQLPEPNTHLSELIACLQILVFLCDHSMLLERPWSWYVTCTSLSVSQAWSVHSGLYFGTWSWPAHLWGQVKRSSQAVDERGIHLCLPTSSTPLLDWKREREIERGGNVKCWTLERKRLVNHWVGEGSIWRDASGIMRSWVSWWSCTKKTLLYKQYIFLVLVYLSTGSSSILSYFWPLETVTNIAVHSIRFHWSTPPHSLLTDRLSCFCCI